MIPITPELSIDASQISERFVRASGPGGQNVNKVATAVELRVTVSALPLPEDAKVRLRRLAGSRLTADDVLMVEAREHRTQAQNRDAARTRLADLVRRALVRPRPRRPTRPSAAARERRVVSKHHRADIKRKRRGGREDD